MRVSDICTRDVVYVAPRTSVREAARIMRQRHVGSIIVAECPDEHCLPIGIVTDRDIVLCVVAKDVDPDEVTVADVMTRALATCNEVDDVFHVLEIMRMRGVRRLPVVDERRALVGVLSADDILVALSTQLMFLTRTLTREQIQEITLRA